MNISFSTCLLIVIDYMAISAVVVFVLGVLLYDLRSPYNRKENLEMNYLCRKISQKLEESKSSTVHNWFSYISLAFAFSAIVTTLAFFVTVVTHGHCAITDIIGSGIFTFAFSLIFIWWIDK